MDKIKLGKYQHFKGNFYQVIAVARHSETLAEFVVYQALYDSPEFGNNAVWIMPKENFLETVIIDGRSVPRFKFVSG